MNKELITALSEIEEEKGISKEIILDALEAALISGYKKNFGSAQNVDVRVNRDTGEVKVYSVKHVVEFVDDDLFEINMGEVEELAAEGKVFIPENAPNFNIEDLEDLEGTEDIVDFKSALIKLIIDRDGNLDPQVGIGDALYIEITPKDFGRIAAQTSKQVITQKIKEAERDIIYEDYIGKEDEILTGVVERTNANGILVNLGKLEGSLSVNEQIPGEEFKHGDRIKVYVVEVRKTSKGPQIILSRTNPGLVKRLFELEVPEIQEGVVEIFNTSREAGSRTKIAVYSNEKGVDPVGACVGFKGNRVRAIVDELCGEKIDIIVWDKDPEVFIKNSLSPAKALKVELNEEENTALVVVPDYQLSLAIGKEGQNARLAAKLTGWKIDIKNKTQYLEEHEGKSEDEELPENQESSDSEEAPEVCKVFDDSEDPLL